MKNLDAINPSIAKPERFAALAGILPLFFGAMGLVFASTAAVAVPLLENPICLLCMFIMATSPILAVFSRMAKWGWRAQYFGSGAMALGSAILLGGVPWLCILVYSTLPVYSRVILFAVYGIVVGGWAWRFSVFYRRIFSDKAQWARLYEYETDAVYYLQKVDKKMLRSKGVPGHFPAPGYLVAFLALALLSCVYAGALTEMIQLPFVHIFLSIGAIPLDMMAAGFFWRAYLIFYHYPAKIYKASGKRVYVDLVSLPHQSTHCR